MSVVRTGLVAAGLLTGLLAATGPARAQGVLVTNSANPYFRGVAPGYGSGYYGGFYPGYGTPASAGSLMGAASVIDAQGNYKINRQQARLISEQVKSAQMDNRQRAIELWKYEQANTPSLEEMRQREIQAKLDRARHNPPLNDVWSGESLNSLLKSLQDLSVTGPSVPLDQDVLRNINVVAPNASGTAGNAGMLKNVGQFNWPLVLQDDGFASDRKALEALMNEAVQQAGSGAVRAGTLKELNAAYGKLQAQLKQRIGEYAPSDNIAAKRYLNQIGESVEALQNPNVTNYVNRKWSARGATVADLVKYMADNGLRFAPASSGDEAAYTVLHRALVNYDTRTAQLVSAGTPAKE